MLEELNAFFSRTPNSYHIALPRLNSYLSGLRRGTRRLVARNLRFTESPIPSSGIDYLNSLITRADINYLLKFNNDVDRLTRTNNEYRSAVYSDYIREYPIRDKSFIYSKRGSTVEYLLITDDIDLIQNLPLGNDDFNSWLNVRPIRMISNDSSELQLDITASRLKYRQAPPTEAVFSINIMKLLMVYTKYRLTNPAEFKDKSDNYPFIFKVCLLPLLSDNIKTWLTKIIHDMVVLKKTNPDSVYDTHQLILGEKSTFALSNRQAALAEIEALITKCAQGKVRPDEVITSIKITGETSLYDEMQWLMNSNYVGNRGVQFIWLAFIREYFILSTVIGIYSLQPDSARTNELRKLFDIIARRWQNTQFANHARNPFIVENINNKFDALCELIAI